jgi:acetylglutamate kinase
MRITDPATLDAVVAVLAGSANTDLVAALVAEHVRAVGLTGVDAGFGRSVRSAAFVASTGAPVDLGLVGDPQDVDAALLRLLLDHGYVPVVASLGVDIATGGILNVNADVIACRIAAAVGESELVIAGGTAGVLDGSGASIARLDVDGIDAAIASGTATAGMVAKLTACRTAVLAGVSPIRLIDGRSLDPSGDIDAAPGTTLVADRAHAGRA